MAKAKRKVAEPIRWRKVDGDKAADAALLVYDCLLEVGKAHPSFSRVQTLLADALIAMNDAKIPVPQLPRE